MSDDLAAWVEKARLPAAHSFLDGRLRGGGGARFVTRHPGNGAALAEVEATGPERLAAAVDTAAAAQPDWARTSPHARAAVLRAAADRLEAGADRLAALVALDNGKTLAEARGDVVVAAALLRTAAGWAPTLEGSTFPADGGTLRMSWREPVGVVAAVIPFNAPLMFTAQKAGPALAAGNAMVLKAPEQAPLAPPVLAGVLAEAGLPPGVLQVVQGDGEVGRLLVAHERVDMISFTGSTRVGRQVMASAAAGMKRPLLELGGKSANIVYGDADLDPALDATLAGIFRNAGQRCFSGSRLLVQDEIAGEVLDRLTERAEKIRTGDPFDPASQVGALISTAEAERVLGVVGAAAAAGARVRCGGTRPAGAHPAGAFVAPTVVEVPRDLPADLPLLREEVFGPVLAVQRFADEADAVALANDSPFGLAGGCWTRDLDRALRTARAVRTGYFWINSYGALALDAPIGGYKSSGFGRELGRPGHEAYTEVKTVIVDTEAAAAPPWFG
ncbi:carnitine dehydratase [Phytohabitans suffuscus]|uniref:Carnitine dehydratase n=1 Tax=Phytohabitans suffuscus TaxID=624315 RepID=A0A6F8YXW2_9ACTN|nr:aldehyde dehydrogenase family protein [Phytohabitans suffuscus]BCB91015.1 carnitine dehydratase [Phytohabitans suffuscus]